MKKKPTLPQVNEYKIEFRLAEGAEIHTRFYSETSKEIVLNNLSYHIKKEYECVPLVESILKYNRFNKTWEKP